MQHWERLVLRVLSKTLPLGSSATAIFPVQVR